MRIGIVLIIILLISSFIYYKNKINQEKIAQEKIRQKTIKQEFLTSLGEINTAIAKSVVKCVEMTETYSSVWRQAIKDGSDFNDALIGQREIHVNFGYLKQIDEPKEIIESKLRALGKNRKLYPSVHKKIVELYGVYSQLHSLAQFPSGSLRTYNKKVGDLKSKFLQLLNELSVLLPSSINGSSNDQPSINGSSNVQLQLTDVTDALTNSGMTIGEKREKLYQMIQAIDGYGVEVNGDVILVYQFDTTISSGRDAIDKWKRDGVGGQPVVVNKNLMLAVDLKHKDWGSILSIFNSL